MRTRQRIPLRELAMRGAVRNDLRVAGSTPWDPVPPASGPATLIIPPASITAGNLADVLQPPTFSLPTFTHVAAADVTINTATQNATWVVGVQFAAAENILNHSSATWLVIATLTLDVTASAGGYTVAVQLSTNQTPNLGNDAGEVSVSAAGLGTYSITLARIMNNPLFTAWVKITRIGLNNSTVKVKSATPNQGLANASSIAYIGLS